MYTELETALLLKKTPQMSTYILSHVIVTETRQAWKEPLAILLLESFFRWNTWAGTKKINANIRHLYKKYSLRDQSLRVENINVAHFTLKLLSDLFWSVVCVNTDLYSYFCVKTESVTF